jgi:hypothetical protein
MTASNTDDQRAAAAQATGESAAAQHATAAAAQHEASGSAVAVEAARTPDHTAVSWSSNVDTTARPSLSPSTPPEVNKHGNHGPPDAA